MTPDEEKLALEKHKNTRDEQFWFTAATITINGLFITKADVQWQAAITISAIISVMAIHLVLTRWLAAAGLTPPGESDSKKDPVLHRLCFTIKQIAHYLPKVPWVFAELSGSAFYITLIGLSFISVIFKYCH